MARYKRLPTVHKKEPDEFVSAVDHALHWIIDYKKPLMIICIAIAVLGIGYLGMKQKGNRDALSVQQKLFQVSQITDSSEKLKALEDVVKDFGGSSIGQLSRLSLADALLAAHDKEKAIQEVSLAAKKAPQPLKDVLSFTHAQLLWGSDKTEEALQIAEKGQSSKILGPYFELMHADILQSQGKKDEALQIYTMLLEKHADDVGIAKNAQSRLIQLSIR